MGWQDDPVISQAPAKNWPPPEIGTGKPWDADPIVATADQLAPAGPRVASGPIESIEAGLQGSAPGLAWRGKLPDLVLDPQHSAWWERALTGIAQVGAELPLMAVGGAAGGLAGGSAGGAAGSVVPGLGTAAGAAAGTVLGSGAGMFALPAAIRESLLQAYKSGDIKTGADWWNALREVATTTVKEGAIGAATFGAGSVAARTVGKALVPAIGESIAVPTAIKAINAADTAAQIATMVSMPAALQGRLPDAQEFLDAAIVIGGLKLAAPVAERLANVYRRTGKTPAEQVQDAQQNPEVAAELRNGPKPDVEVPPLPGQLSKQEELWSIQDRLNELRGKTAGAPEQRTVDDYGNEVVIPAKQPELFTPAEKAEYDGLREKAAALEAAGVKPEVPRGTEPTFSPDQLAEAQNRAKTRLDELSAKATTEALTDAERAERIGLTNAMGNPEALAKRYGMEPAVKPITDADREASAQRVYDDVLRQAREADAARQAAGLTPIGDDHAIAIATLVRARLRARAARLGVLPEDLYNERPLQIRDESQAEVEAQQAAIPPEAERFVPPPEVDLFGNPVLPTNAPRVAGEAIPVVPIPLDQLKLSKDVPQFKAGANARGVVQPLQGEVDLRGVAPIAVWERLNGDLEVISGRHRLDLWERKGRPTIDAQIFKESEGFDLLQATMLDAEMNIRDEHGSVSDYANYFKNSGISEAEAKSRGLLGRAKGQAGFRIAQDASPDLLAAHRAGLLSDDAALVISGTAPGSERLQALGMAMVNDGKSTLFASNMMKTIDLMAAERQAAGQQGDIFGFDDSAMRQAAAMAKKASAAQRKISEQISAVQGAARRPEIARTLGVDVQDPEGIQKKIASLKQEQYQWDNWPLYPELVAKLRASDTLKQDALYQNELAKRVVTDLKEKHPNVVVRDVRDQDGRKLGDIFEKYDGTEEGASAAAQRIERRLPDEFPEYSNVASRIGATDENGNPKWAISPNLQHINPIGTKEAAYTWGDMSAAPTPTPADIARIAGYIEKTKAEIAAAEAKRDAGKSVKETDNRFRDWEDYLQNERRALEWQIDNLAEAQAKMLAAPSAPALEFELKPETPAELRARDAEAAAAAKRKLAQDREGTNGIRAVTAAHDYPPATRPNDEVRLIARGMRDGDPDAINLAAKDMAKLIPEGSTLIPIPDAKGQAGANARLAEAIVAQRGGTVLDALTGPERGRQYDAKKAGAPLSIEQIGTTLREGAQIPDNAILIDNVVATGATVAAARRAIGRDLPIVSYAQERNIAPAIKPRIVTVDQADLFNTQRTLFQSEKDKPWYYSELARSIEASPMKQGTAKAWQDYIKSRVGKGVKNEEIEATGINDWLATQEGKVTKEQVQAFMEQGGVKVTEQVLGGANVATPADPAIANEVAKIEKAGLSIDQAPEGGPVLWGIIDPEGDIYTEAGEAPRQSRMTAEDKALVEQGVAGIALPDDVADAIDTVLTHLNGTEGQRRDLFIEQAVNRARAEYDREISEKIYERLERALEQDGGPAPYRVEEAEPGNRRGGRWIVRNSQGDEFERFRTREEAEAQAQTMTDSDMDRYHDELTTDIANDMPAFDERPVRRAAAAEWADRQEGETVNPRFSQYVEPGAVPGSYLELVLTLPEKNLELPPGYRVEEMPKAGETVQELTAEWNKWLADRHIPNVSAGEIPKAVWNRLTEAEQRYTHEFQDRWDEATSTDQIEGVPPKYRLVFPDGSKVVMPSSQTVEQANDAAMQYLQRVGEMPKRAGFESSHFPGSDYLAHTRVNDRILPDGRKVLFVEEIQSDRAQRGRQQGFTDPALLARSTARFEEAKAAAQQSVQTARDIMRKYINPRIANRDNAADRALEAMEADIGRQGEKAIREQWGALSDEEWASVKKYLDDRRAEDDAEHAVRTAKAAAVPAAPFVTKTDSWTALVLKRLLRYAAEGNYDAIAWTRGEQQVERYTSALRKAVDTIEWKKTPEGVQIIGYKGDVRGAKQHQARMDEIERAMDELIDGRPLAELSNSERDRLNAMQGNLQNASMARPRGQKVVDTTEKETALSDAIGKSMADRIINDPNQSGTIEGENININDTGMAGFYDRIVPKVAEKVAKQVGGGKVGEIALEMKPQWALKFKDGPYRGEIYDADQTGEPIRFDSPGQAREYEKKNGLPPMELVQSNKGYPQQAIEITPEMREKIMAGMPLFQKPGQEREGQHLGSYSIAENLITTFRNANKSTIVHELGHSWLEEMRADAMRPDAPAQIKADWETIRREFAIGENAEISTASHEQFARTAERYLGEGVAPSVGLRGVFERFKAWMLELYGHLQNLGVQINPEVRGVFDRMLATDQEIADAKALNVPVAYVPEARRAEAEKIVPPPEARKIVPGFEAEQASMVPYADELPPGPGEAPDTSHVNYAYINSPMDVKLAMQRMAEIDQANIQKQRGGTRGVKSWAEANAEQARYVNDILGGTEDTLRLLSPRDPNAPGPDVKLGILKKLAVGAAKDSARLRDIVLEAGHDATVRQQLEYMGSIERARMIQAEFLGERAGVARALNALKDVTEGSGEIGRMLDAIGYGEAAARELYQAARTPAEEQAYLKAQLDEILQRYVGRKKGPDGKPVFVGSVLDIAKLHKEIGTLKGSFRMAKELERATTWEMVVEGWRAGLLSGPVTHTTNMFGTAAFQVMRTPVDALAAIIGMARGASPGMGESDRASMSEAIAGLTSYLTAAKEGLTVGYHTFMADQTTGKTESYREAIPGRAGEIIRIPLRLMGAEDAMVTTMYERKLLTEYAMRQAFDEQLNPATREFASRVDYLKDHPTPEIQAAVDSEATRLTFNAPLGEKGAALQNFVRKWNLQWMIPFIRTPINIAKELLRMSPFAPAVAEWRQAIAKGGMERDKALAEITLGTGITALTMAYAFAGNISGNGSPDPGKNRGKAGVWQPYSILIGDTWYDYSRIQPTGTLMGMAADIANIWDYMNDEEKDKVPKLLAAAFSQAITNQTFLQGITNVVNAMSDPTRFGPRFLQQFAGSMVPNMIGQPTAMADPVAREINGMLEAIQARIPGFRQQLAPKLDWLGQPVPGTERLGVIMPVRELHVSDDKVRQEAARLDISLAGPPKKTHIGKGTGKLGDVPLTPEEQHTFAEVGGQMAHEILTNIVNQPDYDAIPDLVKRKIFAKVLVQSHQVAAVAALPPEKRVAYLTSISEKMMQALEPEAQ